MNNNLFAKVKQISYNLIDIPVHSRHRHFSFLIQKNRIISIGYNIGTKTDPLAKRFQHRYDRIHSELNCIKKFPMQIKELKKCVMVNTRLGKSGEFLISKPCESCQKLLRYFDITNVYYTDREGGFVKL